MNTQVLSILPCLAQICNRADQITHSPAVEGSSSKMPTQKPESQAPPPYTSQPQQTQSSTSQERTPLLSSTSQTQREYAYTYTAPSTTNEHSNPPPPAYQAFLYRPLFRTPVQAYNRPRSLRIKICQFLLLSLLFLSITFAICKAYLFFLTFHPPGINLPVPPRDDAPLRIAVIGAGPAGIGAAVRLSEIFSVAGRDPKTHGERQIEIVVFESQGRVGGRMGLGLDTELGLWEGLKFDIEDVAHAELFADARGMVRKKAERILGLRFTDEVIIEEREKVEDVGFLKDDGGFNNRLSRPMASISWGKWANLLFRYTGSFIAAGKLPTGTMRSFHEMIKMTNTRVFESVEEWLEQANLKGSVQMSARERMKINGVGDKYRNEIIEAQVRRQLGQTTEELSDLALSLALAREDMSSSRPTNGLKIEDIFLQFLARTGAEVRLRTRLTSLIPEPRFLNQGTTWKLGFNNEIFGTEVFDKVILTSPWGKNEEEYYRHVVNTVILSTKPLSPSYLNITNHNPNDDIPSQILLINKQNIHNIHEIAYVKDIFGPELRSDVYSQSLLQMYRILSSSALSEEMLEGMWEGGVVRKVVTENKFAYPLLFPREGGWGTFKVDVGLWSTVGVEKVGSAVDLSWAAGENVASLIKRSTEV